MGEAENKPNEPTEETEPAEGAATEGEGTEPTEGQGGDGAEGVKDTHGQPGINKERHDKEMAAFEYQSKCHCAKTSLATAEGGPQGLPHGPPWPRMSLVATCCQ